MDSVHHRSEFGFKGVVVKRYPIIIALLLAFSALSVSSPAFAEDRSAKEGNIVRYTVAEGDTLGGIALKFGAELEDVQTWNELSGLEVEPGRELIVKSGKKVKKKPSGPVPITHRVRPGDTFEGIAKKYKVKISSVKRWNRGVNPRKLQIGQRVRVYVQSKGGASESYGKANGGRLYNGVPLKDGPGLQVRSKARAYATERTTRLIRAALADVKARWPDAPEAIAGDLSQRGGGRIRPHASHQSGRDADISYYYRGNVQLPNLYPITYETLDAVKTWHLFKTLIDTGKVEFIFAVRPVQRALYEYARSIGYTEEELEPILQYPRPNSAREGIIRHVSGHDTHFHIRFTCGPLDRSCR